jgi:lipopolysaccharide/colanic/teichoic acid biosynthesis glycosyltransferase
MGEMQFEWARFGDAPKRCFDAVTAALLLVLFAPLIVVVACAIKFDSPGPVFFRCVRVGRLGRDLQVLKFRKMRHDAAGPTLTSPDDVRLTRIGRWLAKSKLDEVPQLWNVLRGQMSLVGPRPEDRTFVTLKAEEYRKILTVRPGITGLSQLAFARETEILDPDDRANDYITRIFPQKIALDVLYVDGRSPITDARILGWTAAAVLFRREVAVDRATGKLRLRRRPLAVSGTVPVAVSGAPVELTQAEVEA